MTLEELQILITAETSGLKKEMAGVKAQMSSAGQHANKVTDSIKKSFSGIGKAVASAFAVKKVIDYVSDSLTAAGTQGDAFKGLQRTMTAQGRSFTSANAFIQEYISDGLVPLTNAVTAYKSLVARGYNDEQIQQTLTRLKDAAAYGRQASYTLGAAVASAAEGLKNENSILVDNAGVTKNVAKMWEEYAASIGKSANNLTQQEKIQAEVNGIMRETQFQVGDAADYAKGYTGQLAALNKTFQDVRVNSGQAFMPIVSVAIPVLQSLANHLAYVTSVFAQFSQALFGANSAQAKTATVAAKAQTATGNAIAAAGKKAKSAVAGFDEINQLQDSLADSGTGITEAIATETTPVDASVSVGEIGAGVTISPDVLTAVEGVKTLFGGMWDSLKSYGARIGDAFSGIRPAMQPLFDIQQPVEAAMSGIGGSISKLKDKFLKPVADYVLLDFTPGITTSIAESFAPVFADIAVGSVQQLDTTMSNVTSHMTSLWEGTWLPALERLKAAFQENMPTIGASVQSLWNETILPFTDLLLNEFVLPIVTGMQETFVPIFTDISVAAFDIFTESFEWAADVVNDVYKTVIAPVFGLIESVVTDTLGIVSGLWEEHGKRWTDNATDVFKNIRKIFQSIWDSILKPIIEPFLEMVSWLWDKHLKGVVEEVGNFVLKLWNGGMEIYNKFVAPIADFLIRVLGPSFANAFNFIADVVGTVVGVIADIIKGLIRSIGGVVDFIVGVFTGDWKKAWEGIKDIFGGIWDGVVGIFKGGINLIIDALNLMLRNLNRISFDVPSWVPAIGGSTWGFNIPTIPKLANGGIVDANNPMLAVIGDNKTQKEVVSPLGDLRDMIASAVGTAMAATLQTMGGSQAQSGGDIVIQLDGVTLARVLYPYTRQEGNRLGSTVFQTT